MSILHKIGVTGNICSGKSALVRYMSTKPKCFVLNLDEIAHQIYARNFFIQKILNENFNNSKNFNNQSYDLFSNYDSIYLEFKRKELGKIVFENESQLNKLNVIVRNEVLIKLNSDISHLEFQLPSIYHSMSLMIYLKKIILSYKYKLDV